MITLPRPQAPRGLPSVGARIPAACVLAALAVLGVLLDVLCYWSSSFLFFVGLVATGVAVVRPRRLFAWVLLLLLAASELPHDHPSLNARLLLLVAGLHLLHVLAAHTVELPARGWVQLEMFRRPLLRFLIIQIPTQLIAVLTLRWLAPHSDGSRPVTVAVFGLLGAAALVVVTLLLAVPLLRERRRD